jgi:hypothetical protein
VTRRHGEIFAEEWFLSAHAGESVWKAFELAGVVVWPEDDPNRPLGEFFDARRARYQDIEDEILEKVFANLRPAVAQAFVKVSRKVLGRERRR